MEDEDIETRMEMSMFRYTLTNKNMWRRGSQRRLLDTPYYLHSIQFNFYLLFASLYSKGTKQLIK